MASQTQFAISESGQQVAGENVWGYHGSNKYQQALAIVQGLPADGGSDRDLALHVAGHAQSAFRGTVGLPAGNSQVLAAAADWAGVNGLVYEIVGVVGWDANLHAAQAVRFHMRQEAEVAILREVPVQNIKRLAPVQLKSRGGVAYTGLGPWINV